ncbi:MAG: S1C family serine protease [Candidatus Moduliflexus flocculans]|nr:S1C family serine protease [Candidatus Moduliflexus flocculans]
MALAVPVDVVRDIVAQIKEKGRVERGWMGVGIGVDESGRTVIGAVDPESPAELAKLRLGDVVLKIGDRDVTGPDVLAAEIRKKKPGQEVTLKIERDGKPLDVKVKLGELAEADRMKEMDVRFPGLFGRVAPGPGPSPQVRGPAVVVRVQEVHRHLLQRAEPGAGRAFRRQGGDGPDRLPADRRTVLRPKPRCGSATSSSASTARGSRP